MPLDLLLEALERDTVARVAAIRAEAEAEAARVRAFTDASREARLEAREAVLVAERERALEPARHEARRRVLRARARLLARVEAAAREALASVDRLEDRILDDALSYVDGPAVVRCRPSLAAQVEARTRGRPVRVEVAPDADPGMVVRAEDGSVSVDATLERRLVAAMPGMARAVLDLVGAPP